MKITERSKGQLKRRLQEATRYPFEFDFDDSKKIANRRSERRKLTDFRRKLKISNTDSAADFFGDAQDRIRILIAQERLAQKKGDHFLKGESQQEIFEAYIHSGLYARTLAITVGSIRREGAITVEDVFVGRVFEDLCYGILSQRYSGEDILLSPERSNQVIAALFPYAHTRTSPLGSQYILLRESYEPDGLVISTTGTTPKVKEVFEYTAGLLSDRKLRQHDKYNLMVKKYPALFLPKASFTVVTLEGNNFPEGLGKGMGPKEIPISPKYFGGRVNRLWQNAVRIAGTT